jgi:hypothetical protein
MKLRSQKQPFRLGYDQDFTQLATLDLDHTAASVAIGGITWQQTNGTANLDDLDITNGTGVVANMGAANSAFDIDSNTHWHLRTAVTNLVPEYVRDDLLWIEMIVGDLGDADTEICGIYFGNDSIDASARGHAFSTGWGGGVAVVRRLRQQGAAVAGRNNAVVATAIAMRTSSGQAVSYHGTASGTDFPSTWTRLPRGSTNDTVPAADSFNGSDEIHMWAATGNTDNNYAPSIKRLRIWIVRDSTLTPYLVT